MIKVVSPSLERDFFEGLSMRACDGDRTHVDLKFLDMKSEEEFRVEDAPQRLASTRNLETWNIVQL